MPTVPAAESDGAAAAAADGRTGTLAFIAAGAMFMENLDATVITTALPAIAASFGCTPVQAGFGVSGYLLAAALCVPLSGWLADRFGARRLLCAAVLLFTVASVLCGLAGGLAEFVALRMLQGAAAALMTPVARLAVVRTAAKAALLRAVAVMTWPALIAPVLGPPLGGLLTTYASWRWIFFINLPVGLLGIALAWRFVPHAPAAQRKPFDMAGYALMAAALASLIVGLQLLVEGVGGWRGAALLLAAGGAIGLLALRRAARHPHPVFSLAAARVRSFAVSTVSGGFLSRLAISATPFLLPLLFQVGFGLPAAASGALLLAYFAGNIGMKLVTTRTVRWLGFRNVLLLNGVALAASIAACALLRPAWPVPWLAAVLFAGGCARSLQMTALNSLTYADVPPEQTASANTLASLVQQIALTMGVATGGLLLSASAALRVGSGNGSGSGSGSGTAGGALVLQDFAVAFGGIALLAALALPSYRLLSADAGAAVSGHRPRDRR